MLLLKLLIIAAHHEIRKLLLCLAEFLVIFLLIGINSFDLISGSNFYFCSMSSKIIRVLTVLTERISKCSTDARLGQRASILLFEHILLLSEFFEPRVLQGLTCCYSVIRVVNKQFLNKILHLRASMRNQFDDSSSFHQWEVKLHMSCVFLEIVH